MCGKRLNDWKTIPIRRRSALTSTLRAVISSPPTTDPAGLDRLEQVDAAQERRLAGARRADQADDLVLGDVEVDPAQHLELAEGLVQRPRCAAPRRCPAHAVAHTSLPAWCCFRSRAISQSVKRASGIVISDEQRRRDEVRRAVERRGLVDLRLLERLDDAERADERRVLLQPDEVVEERRDHAPHGLGEDDEAQRLAAREAERARGGLLARVHRLDPRAVDLGDVRGVDEHERDDGPEELRRSAATRARAPASRSRASRSRGSSGCRGRGRRRRSRARGSGRTPGPGSERSTATKSAAGRMSTSATQKSFTLSQKAWRISGKLSL